MRIIHLYTATTPRLLMRTRLCIQRTHTTRHIDITGPTTRRIIDKVLALLALLVRYAHVAIPVVSTHTFETLLVAFLLLLAGNLFKGF